MEKLYANNSLIISPNRLFGQYISKILPELGEEHVASYIFEEIIETYIHTGRFQPYREFLELLAENRKRKGSLSASAVRREICQ